MAPGKQVDGLWDDRYFEGQIGERHYAVGHVENEVITRMICTRLNIVKPIFIDDRLIEDVDFRRMAATPGTDRHRCCIIFVIRTILIYLQVTVLGWLTDDIDNIFDIDTRLRDRHRCPVDGDAGALLSSDTAKRNNTQRLPVGFRKNSDIQQVIQNYVTKASPKFEEVPR